LLQHQVFAYVIFSVIFLTGNLAGYYAPILGFTFSTGVIYGISLAFTAREKLWLKAAGIFISIINLILVSIMLRTLFFPNIQVNEILEKINQWT